MIIDENKEIYELKQNKGKGVNVYKALWLLAKECQENKVTKKDAVNYIRDFFINNGIEEYDDVTMHDKIESTYAKCIKLNILPKRVSALYFSKNELDTIKKLNTLTSQRLAFGFLANAKREDAKSKKSDNKYKGFVTVKMGDIFSEIKNKKLTSTQQGILVGKLIRDGYLELYNMNSYRDLTRKVLFMEHDLTEENSEIKLEHWEDYILEWDNYIGNGVFKRCEKCNRIIKRTSNRLKYCKPCKDEAHRGSKLASYHKKKLD